MKEKILITDVTARDGLQVLPKSIPTSSKLELIRRLREAGCSSLEVTSFVNPQKVPQFYDAKELLAAIDFKDQALVLIPNVRGLERALEVGAKNINVLSSASDAFAKKNLGKDLGSHFLELDKVLILAQKEHLKVRASLSMAFFCPDEKEISLNRLEEQLQFFSSRGVEEIVLCDTCSGANSFLLKRSLSVFKKFPQIGLHLHSQGGREMVLIEEALGLGIRLFETGLKESGGCPFNEGSKSNTSTEDLVELLQNLGQESGIDLASLREVQKFYRTLL